MRNIFITIFVFFSSAALPALAQNISTATIQWNADRVFNATTGQWSEQATALVTYGASRIEWKNSNGSIRSRFQVIELIGEWSNVNEDGFTQYEITDGTHSGTITIRKEGAETKVLISLGATEPTLEELTISSKQTL
jgi:hypothetical protein